MKFLFISSFIFLIPFYLFGQEISLPEQASPVVLTSHDTGENFQLIEPVLMRESSTLNYQNNVEFQNHNKFQAFFSSLIVPGSGQIRNRNWFKAGLFLAIEAASVFLYVDNRNDARVGERNFEKFSNRNWSVVQYSNWLVQYHEVNGLENPHVGDLKQMLGGAEATFNIEEDWSKVDINLLRDVERNTPFVTSDNEVTNNFSHTLPEFGSQQYYELISKFFQYQGGWRDYNDFHNSIGHTGTFFNERFLIERTGSYASPFFFEAAQMAEEFNSDFRSSNTFVSILIANHLLSAFDAYFTLKLRQNRLQATSSLLPGKQFSVSYSF